MKISSDIEKLSNFFQIDSKNKQFKFPLKIVINNIAVPLIVVLNFFVTNDIIDINKKNLNFDKVYADESSIINVNLNNKSALIQKYGFILLPPQISANNCIDNILPNESTSVDIKYESKDFLGHREGDIV